MNRFNRGALAVLATVGLLVTSVFVAVAPATAVGNTASVTAPNPACGTSLTVGYSLTTDVVAGAVVFNGEVVDAWAQSAGDGEMTFDFEGFIDPTMPTYTFGLVNGEEIVMPDTVVQSSCGLPPVQFTFDLARCANPDLYTFWQANSNDTVAHIIELRRDGASVYGPSELAAGAETGVQTLDLGVANIGKPYTLEFYVDGVLDSQVSSVVPNCIVPVLVTAPKVVTSSVRVGVAAKCLVAYTGANSYTYGWKRGTSVITGASKSTYVPSYLDLGKRLSCFTTATNAVGTTSVATSAASAVVALGYAPKVVAPYPKIVGTPTRGKYIGIVIGPWTPKPTYYTCTLNRYVGSKIVRTLGPVKCLSTTKFKVPTKYAKGTKYFITVRAYKPGYAVGAKNTAVFKSR